MDVVVRVTQDAKTEFTKVNEHLRKCDNEVYAKKINSGGFLIARCDRIP